MKTIGLSFLTPSPTLGEALQSLSGISRTQMQKQGLKKADLNRRVDQNSEFNLPINILNYGLINPNYKGSEVKILTETNDLVVLSKPSKVHCHPLGYDEGDNVLSYLRSMGRSDLLRVNQAQFDRGLIYRLDYETSGLLLYAKLEELYHKLRDNFHSMVKKKKYLALVKGDFPKDLELKHLIEPSGPKGQKMKESVSGKEAHIKVRLIEKRNEFSFIEVELDQGLRHQIRVQLSLAGFPILGDELYGGQKSDRLYLHCYQYEIEGLGAFEDPIDW